MQPLSTMRRRIYFGMFFMLFLLCIPVAIFLASGYRLSPEFGFVRTGGIFLSVPYNNAVVYMNGAEVGRTGLLNRGFYIDSLTPDSYAMRVEREGSLAWHRTLVVEPEIVTDARALLLPETVDVFEISTISTTSTSTRVVSRAQFSSYVEAFDVALATTTVGREGETLFLEKGNIYVRIVSDAAIPPSRYCSRPLYCVREIAIEEGKQVAIGAFYLGDNVVYITEEGGVFFAEPDVRPTAVTAPLYARKGSEARLVDGRLIIRDEDEFFEVVGI